MIHFSDIFGGDTGTVHSWSVTVWCGDAPEDADISVGVGSLSAAGTPLDLPINATNLEHTSTLTVAEDCAIAMITVSVDIPHAYRNDLDIILTSPSGTEVMLNENKFVSGANFIGVFMDGGAGPAAGEYVPHEPLSTLIGESSQGTWTFWLEDTFPSSDHGTFNGWGVNIWCQD
jgi:subtilisin-like proprotein convertase family protein